MHDQRKELIVLIREVSIFYDAYHMFHRRKVFLQYGSVGGCEALTALWKLVRNKCKYVVSHRCDTKDVYDRTAEK